MKTKSTLFRRAGVYYSRDSTTDQQKSRRTCDEAETLKPLNARNGSTASRFRRRSHKTGRIDVTLHWYRYAVAEHAKAVEMPERFRQAALGRNSKTIPRAEPNTGDSFNTARQNFIPAPDCGDGTGI